MAQDLQTAIAVLFKRYRQLTEAEGPHRSSSSAKDPKKVLEKQVADAIAATHATCDGLTIAVQQRRADLAAQLHHSGIVDDTEKLQAILNREK